MFDVYVPGCLLQLSLGEYIYSLLPDPVPFFSFFNMNTLPLFSLNKSIIVPYAQVSPPQAPIDLDQVSQEYSFLVVLSRQTGPTDCVTEDSLEFFPLAFTQDVQDVTDRCSICPRK